MAVTGRDIWSGMMRTVEPFGVKTLARSAGYLLVGGLGALALTIPLFGVLAYLASPLLPLLFAWFVAGAFLPIVRPGRAAHMYLFGNLGVLAATLSVFMGGLDKICYFARGARSNGGRTALSWPRSGRPGAGHARGGAMALSAP